MNKMDEDESKKLNKDAIYWHLIGQGYSDWEAKIRAEKMMSEP